MKNSLFYACLTPLLVAGCWYKSFSIDPSLDGGGGGAGGSLGGASGTGGAIGGEGGVLVGPLTARADEITIEQGESLAGDRFDLLANDSGEGLRVVDFDDTDPARPGSIDAEEFTVDADGLVAFTPAPDFFGVYRFTYEVEDASGQRASAEARIVVRPRRIRLALVAAGYGGFVVDGGTGDGLGQRVARGFDVNGDGAEDFLVGADDGGAGYAAVVYGRADAESFSLGDASITGKATILAGPTMASVGMNPSRVAVAGARDLNGDGRADVLIGAPGPTLAEGAAYVVFGKAAFGTNVDLSALTSEEGYRLDGFDSAQSGKLVAGGADVDGDGVPDVVVSSNHASEATPLNEGSISVVLGPGAAGAITVERGLFINGFDASQRLDIDVSLLGDLDGDERSEVAILGLNDLLVLRGVAPPSSWPLSQAAITSGATASGWRESFGSPDPDRRVSGVGDFNGDGTPDLVLCDGGTSCSFRVGRANLNLASGFGLAGLGSAPRVDGGADVNGDGLSDFVLVDSARGYVVLGRSVLPTDDLSLSSPTENEIFVEAEIGAPLVEAALLGDVNGDGRADLAFTAPSHGVGAGRVYIVFGP